MACAILRTLHTLLLGGRKGFSCCFQFSEPIRYSPYNGQSLLVGICSIWSLCYMSNMYHPIVPLFKPIASYICSRDFCFCLSQHSQFNVTIVLPLFFTDTCSQMSGLEVHIYLWVCWESGFEFWKLTALHLQKAVFVLFTIKSQAKGQSFPALSEGLGFVLTEGHFLVAELQSKE